MKGFFKFLVYFLFFNTLCGVKTYAINEHKDQNIQTEQLNTSEHIGLFNGSDDNKTPPENPIQDEENDIPDSKEDILEYGDYSLNTTIVMHPKSAVTLSVVEELLLIANQLLFAKMLRLRSA